MEAEHAAKWQAKQEECDFERSGKSPSPQIEEGE